MGVIAAFIGTVFSGISGLFTVFLARKATFSAAYIAIYLVLVVAFIAVVQGLLSSIVAAVPSNSFLLAGLSLLPSNTGTCISLISTAHVAAWAFTFKEKLLQLKVNA